MNDTEQFKLEFTGVYLQASNCALLTSEVEEFSAKQIDHTYAYLFYDGKWYMLKQWPNAIVSMTHSSNGPTQLFFLTANGKVYRRAGGNISEEIIDPSDEGPSDLLLMRKLISVSNELFAVGMARRAYRRDSNGIWFKIDDTCFVRRQDRTSATGFNDVAAYGDGLLAVGYKGEIWRYDGKGWHSEPSPTNVTLTCVAVSDEAGAVIAGLGGLLIKGTSGAWSEVVHQERTGDFWGAVSFKGSVYLSSREGVFKLTGNQLTRVQIDAHSKHTTAYVSATSDAIWSVGPSDIYSSGDGISWNKMDNP